MTSELKRAGEAQVLPQVETRGRVWNPDTLQWEPENTNDLLNDILAKLEEIRVLLSAPHPW